MQIEASVDINGSKEAIWAVISDIENAANSITGIEKVEILEKPNAGLVGLKWRETRKMMGKEATETMWIPEAVENEYYKTRAESHGCIYQCGMNIAERGDQCTLTMTHKTTPQSVGAKLMCGTMGRLFKGAFRKMLMKDLNDIKRVVEAK